MEESHSILINQGKFFLHIGNNRHPSQFKPTEALGFVANYVVAGLISDRENNFRRPLTTWDLWL